MSPSEKMIKADKNLIEGLSDSISSAVGDDIGGDIKSHGLITQNSTPTRIWDFLNTNLCKKFIEFDIVAHPTKRGPWGLVPIFERKTGFLYILMRESRLKTLKEESSKRKNAHYAEALAKSLNGDLVARQYQIPLLEINNEKFENEEYIRKIVQKIFEDLGVPGNVVKRHALVLFNDVNGVLLSLRCCIVDSNLHIVEEANWNEYIKVNESTIAEEVTDESSKYNDPSNGLKYKQKAKDKINQKKIAKEKHKKEELPNLS